MVSAAAYSADALVFTAVVVAGGKAVLPVWMLPEGGSAPSEYAGNDAVSFTLGFFPTESVATRDMENYMASASAYVSFENGRASYAPVAPYPRY